MRPSGAAPVSRHLQHQRLNGVYMQRFNLVCRDRVDWTSAPVCCGNLVSNGGIPGLCKPRWPLSGRFTDMRGLGGGRIPRLLQLRLRRALPGRPALRRVRRPVVLIPAGAAAHAPPAAAPDSEDALESSQDA
jgi:hypothetical protein